MGFWKDWLGDHYLLVTSGVAIGTALANLKIIYWMTLEKGIDDGLGLAAIGIITFFGTLLSSSIFEEHRHNHGIAHASDKIIVGKDVDTNLVKKLEVFEIEEFSKDLDNLSKGDVTGKDKIKTKLLESYKNKKSNFIFVDKNNPKKDKSGNFIENVIVGTGIMRKSLAASLVITYLVLIGLSFSAGSLGDQLGGEPKEDTPEDNLETKSILGAVSHFIVSGQIYEIAFGAEKSVNLSDGIELSESSSTNQKNTSVKPEKPQGEGKTVEQLLLEKNPRTLVEHFTIVITAVIGFYFGSNTINALLKARKEDKSNDDLSKINKKLEKQEELVKIITEIKDKLTNSENAKSKISKDEIDVILKSSMTNDDKIDAIIKKLK